MVKKFIKIILLFFTISQFICENIKLNKYDDLYNNKIRYLNQKESNKDSSKKNIRDKLSLWRKNYNNSKHSIIFDINHNINSIYSL